jgi:hypothetical protein
MPCLQVLSHSAYTPLRRATFNTCATAFKFESMAGNITVPITLLYGYQSASRCFFLVRFVRGRALPNET